MSLHVITSRGAKDIAAADALTVGLVQLAPVWGNRSRTLEKVSSALADAIQHGCNLVCFSEALVPGYPFWIGLTDGARFDDAKQKEIYAHYLREGVILERGDLDTLCEQARAAGVAVYVGCMERALDRGGHSLYCSLVYINEEGQIASIHRKLQPTYEERLVWAQGDGHGLRTHSLGAFNVGGLNCWENWLPLARAALYGSGEDLHVSVWPGGLHNTKDIARFIALESRSYVIAVSGLMRPQDYPDNSPYREEICAKSGDFLANGGSGIVAPNGDWVIEPVVEKEALLVATLDHRRVREERQNLDIVGHYSRPDVTQLQVNRARQSTVVFSDSPLTGK